MSENKNNSTFKKLGTAIGKLAKGIAEFFKGILQFFNSLAKKNKSSSVKYNKSTGKKRGKGKVRYDRLGVLAAAFIVLIVLIIVLIKALVASGDKDDDRNKSKNDSNASSTSTSESVIDPGVSNDNTVAYTETVFTYDQIKTGNLIVVNNSYEFTFPEAQSPSLISVMENKNSSYAVSNANILLDGTAIKQFNSMMEAFSTETGLSNIELKQGYRTKEYQQELYDSGKSVVAPGYTEHHTGLAVNISILNGSDYKKYDYNDLPGDDYKWIFDNCAKYGFIPRYTLENEQYTLCEAESDHFRYVGVPHAYYMTENNLCLEQYLETVKQYTFDNPLQRTCEYDSRNYVIYYTEATVAVGVSNQTNVWIPTNAEYTISGDNMGGFIVTVTQ